MNRIEVCCNSLTSAYNAQKAGADRIELCANLDQGGITPSYGTIKSTVESLQIPINVLIRPRAGDFLYNELEIKEIFEDIKLCKNLGIAGVVCGFLKKDGTVDEVLTKVAIATAKPMSVTFSRAFDLTKDPIKSLKQLINLKVDRLLTSGAKHTAWEGKELIKQMVEIAKEDIIIMAGSGINEKNVTSLIKYCKIKEIHFSGTKEFNSEMEYKKQNILCNEEIDFKHKYSDIQKITNIIKSAKNEI